MREPRGPLPSGGLAKPRCLAAHRPSEPGGPPPTGGNAASTWLCNGALRPPQGAQCGVQGVTPCTWCYDFVAIFGEEC